MKKRQSRRPLLTVFLLTAVAIGGMRWYAHTTQSQRPTVTAVTIQKTDVTETVICTGTVSVAEGTKVYATTPCVAGTVEVSVGDRVKKGDVLVTVDRAATLGLALSTVAVDTSLLSSVPEAVTAPTDGVVSAVSANEGELIDHTSPCVVLSDSHAVEIAVSIREKSLPKIKIGQEVTVSGVAFAKKSYCGTVTSIASSARSRVSGSGGETVVDAVVSLYEGEADESLLVGLTAKATVTVAVHKDQLLVPYECLTQDEEGHTAVYCVDGNAVIRRPITVAQEYADGASVSEGLCEGDRVATEPSVLEAVSVWYTAEE